MARWVLPVLVGPSTAVTPAPGARSDANVDEVEKGIFSGVSFISGDDRRGEARQRRSNPHFALLPDGLLRCARNDGISVGAICADSVSLCDAKRSRLKLWNE